MFGPGCKPEGTYRFTICLLMHSFVHLFVSQRFSGEWFDDIWQMVSSTVDENLPQNLTFDINIFWLFWPKKPPKNDKKLRKIYKILTVYWLFLIYSMKMLPSNTQHIPTFNFDFLLALLSKNSQNWTKKRRNCQNPNPLIKLFEIWYVDAS